MTIDAKEYLEKKYGRLGLGKLLFSIRIGEEMTQDEFAKILKISKSHLCDIEKGRKFVSPERAAKFAKKLGYSEKQFIRLSLQDVINQSGLKFEVQVEEMT